MHNLGLLPLASTDVEYLDIESKLILDQRAPASHC
jgi:hypothetical protein